MSIRQYLYSKAITLSFLGIGMMLLLIFMAFVGVDGLLIWAIMLLYVLLIAAWLTGSYQMDRARLRKVERMAQELSDKYLLGEVLPKPTNVVEKQYFEVMKTISRSAIGVAEEAVREKEEYCDYVESWIHEIKTPLTACSLILANGGDPGKLKQELKRADNLTECILYYARMRTPEKDTQIQQFHVAPVIEEAVKSQMELLIAANISVEVTGDFSVHSDAKLLGFMIKQLLVNCAKYCPGCHIHITAQNGTITVEDNGIGIPKHELTRVTERGFTGTNGRRLGGSTGMGLYLIRELCRQMEMTFEIDSKQGEYTRVCLSFRSLTEL